MDCFFFGLCAFIIFLIWANNKSQKSEDDWQSATATSSSSQRGRSAKMYSFSSADRGARVRERDFGGVEIGENYFPITDTCGPGQFMAAARSPDSSSGGANNSGMVALLDHYNSEIRWVSRLAHPTDVAVTDDGDVLAVDAGGSSRRGEAVVCLDSRGGRRWRHNYGAEVLELEVSQTGNRCFVSTGGSGGSHRTFVYNIRTGDFIFDVDYVRNLRFDGDDLVLQVEGYDGQTRSFAFDDSGELPERFEQFRRHQRMLRAQDDPEFAVRVLQNEFNRQNTDYNRVEQILDSVLVSAYKVDEHNRAWLYLYAGDLAARKKQWDDAADHWQHALDLDKDVGCKTRLNNLRKRRAKRADNSSGPSASPDPPRQKQSPSAAPRKNRQPEESDDSSEVSVSLDDPTPSALETTDSSTLFDGDSSTSLGSSDSSSLFDSGDTDSLFGGGDTDSLFAGGDTDSLFGSAGSTDLFGSDDSSSLFDSSNSSGAADPFERFEAAYDEADRLRRFGNDRKAIQHYWRALDHLEEELDANPQRPLPSAPYYRFAELLVHMDKTGQAMEVFDRYEKAAEKAETHLSASDDDASVDEQLDVRQLKQRVIDGEVRKVESKYR